MSTSDTEVSRNSLEIVRSFITTWNDHDINATMELLDPDIAFQSPLFSDPSEASGRAPKSTRTS
jgi:hypothetical protein